MAKGRKQYQHDYYLKRKAEKQAIGNADLSQIQDILETKRKPIFSGNGGGFMSFAGPPKASDGVSDQTVLNQFSSWTYTCASYNGASVASANLRLYVVSDENDSKEFLHKTIEKGSQFLNYVKNESSVKTLAKIRSAVNLKEIVDHPLLDLLQNINPNNNNFETFEETSIFLDMVGNSFWYIAKNAMGVPVEIWLLKSQHMHIIPGKTASSFIKGYVLKQSSGKEVFFKPDEIIHFKTPNPNSNYYGKGCAQAAISAINRFNMMDASEGARLKNMGRPDFAVKYKNGKIDSSEIKKVEKMWNSAFGGPNKAGKIKVFDEDWDLETLGFTPKEMDYLKSRVWSLKEIAAAFGIPYPILDATDVKKATSELSEYWYAKNAVLPRITRIEEKLNEKLVPMYDPTGRMFLLYDNPVPRDKAQLTIEHNAYITSGVLSINEVRRSLQLPAYEDEKFDMPFASGSNSSKSTETVETVEEPVVPVKEDDTDEE